MNNFVMNPIGGHQFGNRLAQIFMENLSGKNGQPAFWPQEVIDNINQGAMSLAGVELYKRVYLGAAANIKPLILGNDTLQDGLCSFDGQKIPKGSNMVIGHIWLGHGFSAAGTAAAPTAASGLFFQNIIRWYSSYTNAAAATPTTTTFLRDSATSANRVPEELLSAELQVNANGVEIFRKRVRAMFNDSMLAVPELSKGYPLEVPKLLKQETTITANLIFPTGVTIPQTDSSVNHYVEFGLIGIGTKVKA